MINKANISIWLKRILFAVLVGALFIPMAQEWSEYYEEEPLFGSYEKAEEPVLQLKNWLSGAYQKQKATYRNEQIGFRPRMIRFYNQWHYNLYNEARANNVIIGKEEYLFGKEYIKAYQGKDFMGEEVIAEKMAKLLKIKDTLAQKNIDLVVILAPGKASYFPEFIPDEYKKAKDAPTNQAEIKKQLQENKIKCLDFFGWFDIMKPNAAYPLFPKTGIHWSKYAEVLVADSLLQYISQLRKSPMPVMDTTGFEIDTEARDTDDDIEKGLNIFYKIPDLEMGYFTSEIIVDSSIAYPKVSMVGDSYCWGLVGLGLLEKGFNKGDFWYYFNELHKKDEAMQLRADIKDVIGRIEANDALILLSTDANLKTFFHGFVDQMYDLYYPETDNK